MFGCVVRVGQKVPVWSEKKSIDKTLEQEVTQNLGRVILKNQGSGSESVGDGGKVTNGKNIRI